MDKETKGLLSKILIIVGIVAAVAGIAFAVYKFIVPKFIEKYNELDDDDDDYYEVTPEIADEFAE